MLKGRRGREDSKGKGGTEFKAGSVLGPIVLMSLWLLLLLLLLPLFVASLKYVSNLMPIKRTAGQPEERRDRKGRRKRGGERRQSIAAKFVMR